MTGDCGAYLAREHVLDECSVALNLVWMAHQLQLLHDVKAGVQLHHDCSATDPP